jgi:hypothetical protein
MNEESNEHIYMMYRGAKRLIERTESCCEKDHSGECMFQEWKEAIRIFDGLGRGYAERYEKEKADAAV